MVGFGIPGLVFCLPVACHATHGKSPNLCPAHMTYPVLVISRPQIRAPDFWTHTSFVMVCNYFPNSYNFAVDLPQPDACI